ncbi:hypothetical protein KBTX_02305 [wastewater metagenome]|uniref:Ribbon-helix-helix protein CopG domain-containing protein n=2 Tax=unclassified sequences TaxID=12908 RepID=A0A5B8RBA1_9ZZZZ|nr:MULTISPECIES: ribbon-helix-helix protein, CopG family [Arhodomonas]QEA05976.1 hypothetical protein KBTEX_02305 [uncultured organism]
MGVTTVRFQPEVEQGLEAMAQRLQRSKGWLINQAMAEYLERHQREQARWQATLDAVESATQGRVADGEAVHNWLRSWGQTDELPPPKAGE